MTGIPGAWPRLRADGRRAHGARRDPRPAVSERAPLSVLFKYASGEDVKEVFDMRPFIDELTVAMVREAAETYLVPSRYVEVTLLPEAK